MATILKHRKETVELQILRLLNPRMQLNEDERKRYWFLEKGFTGEKLFDTYTEKLRCDVLILNHLLLEINNYYFEIDTLIIEQKTIFIYDVKYFEGDYIYTSSDNSIQRVAGGDMQNCLHQLQRCETSFRQFLRKIGYQSPIEAKIIFNNPNFTLYQSILDLPIYHPTQITQLIKKLDQLPTKVTNHHFHLAERLINAHHDRYPLMKVPAYSFDALKKGINCEKCQSFSITVGGRNLTCNGCGYEEGIDSAVLRMVSELKLLFPEMKVTSKVVHEWCSNIDSVKTIRRVLSKNFKLVGYGQWSYYE